MNVIITIKCCMKKKAGFASVKINILIRQNVRAQPAMFIMINPGIYLVRSLFFTLFTISLCKVSLLLPHFLFSLFYLPFHLSGPIFHHGFSIPHSRVIFHLDPLCLIFIYSVLSILMDREPIRLRPGPMDMDFLHYCPSPIDEI